MLKDLNSNDLLAVERDIEQAVIDKLYQEEET